MITTWTEMRGERLSSRSRPRLESVAKAVLARHPELVACWEEFLEWAQRRGTWHPGGWGFVVAEFLEQRRRAEERIADRAAAKSAVEVEEAAANAAAADWSIDKAPAALRRILGRIAAGLETSSRPPRRIRMCPTGFLPIVTMLPPAPIADRHRGGGRRPGIRRCRAPPGIHLQSW